MLPNTDKLHVLPLITEYYQSTASYEGILKRIKLNADDGYYCFINPWMFIAQIFIEKRMGLQEKARRDFEKLRFPSEDNKKLYLKKFNQL